MASFNGNIGTPSGGFNLKVEYSISQSVSGNYSDVTATGYVKRNNSSYKPYNSSSSSSLTINGTAKSYTGSYGSIYVPASLVNSYKKANVWSQWSDRITSIK